MPGNEKYTECSFIVIFRLKNAINLKRAVYYRLRFCKRLYNCINFMKGKLFMVLLCPFKFGQGTHSPSPKNPVIIDGIPLSTTNFKN